jgi:hypothetical protein
MDRTDVAAVDHARHFFTFCKVKAHAPDIFLTTEVFFV